MDTESPKKLASTQDPLARLGFSQLEEDQESVSKSQKRTSGGQGVDAWIDAA